MRCTHTIRDPQDRYLTSRDRKEVEIPLKYCFLYRHHWRIDTIDILICKPENTDVTFGGKAKILHVQIFRYPIDSARVEGNDDMTCLMF